MHAHARGSDAPSPPSSREEPERLFPGGASGGRELERLYRVALALHTSWGREERLAIFVRGAQKLLGFDRVSVLLATPDGTGLELTRVSREPDALPPAILPLSRAAGPFYQAFQTRRPVAVLSDRDLARILPLDGSYRTHPAFRTRRFIVAPLVAGGRAIGVAGADNKPSRRLISRASVGPLTLLGQLLATALEETRLHGETRAREQDTALLGTGLRLLAQASRALHRTRDLDAMLTGALGDLAHAFGASAVFVDLLAPDGALARRVGCWLAEAHGRDAPPEPDLLTRLVCQTRAPFLLPDITERPDIVPLAHFRHHVASLAVLPVIGEEERVLGVLSLCYPLPQRFPESERHVLAAFADHLAIALENARLYEETERRRRETEILSELGRTLTASLELDAVLRRVAEGAQELCASDLAMIALRDPRTGALAFRQRLGARGPQEEGLRLERGKGALGQVLATGRPFRTNDGPSDPRVGGDAARLVEAEGVHAATVVPIRMEARVEGLLYVGNRSARPITERDEAVLVRLADSAAVAIKNARLYAEATRGRREAEELARVARTLTESLDISALGERVVQSVLPLFAARSAGLRLLRPDGALVAVASTDPSGVHFGAGNVVPPGMGVSGRVIATGGPVRSGDVLAEPGIALTEEGRRRVVASGHRAFLAVPLNVKGKTVGVLSVADQEGRAFSEADGMLLQAFADQAALALENAQLYQRAADRARKLTALSDLTRRITSASDSQEVFRAVSVAATTLLGARAARVWIDEPHERVLRVQSSFGIDPVAEPLLTEVSTFPHGQGVVGRAFASREPVYVADVQADPHWANRRLARAAGLRACAGLPLTAGDRTVGVLVILFGDRREFTAEDKELMSLLAGHAAVAIRNAQLFAREQAARTAAELSEQRFRDLVQSLDAIVWEAEASTGQLLFVSQRVEAALGYPVERWLAEPDFWLTHVHREDRERVVAEGRAALAEGGDFEREYRFLAAGDRAVWLRDRVHVVRGPAGHVRLRGVTVEITESKRLQEELIQAEKLATLGELIAGIAHELNNPLAAVTGHAQLLRIAHPDGPTAARVERLFEAAQRASRVVRNFLTFARRHRPERVPVSVNDLVTKTLELLGYQLRVNNIEVQTTLTPALPPVAGDPYQLQQVLLNLFNNACQAMAGARGGGCLRVGSALAPERGSVRVTVADDGPGIPPEHLPRIFEPFFTTKPPGEGTGLGLAIAHGIVIEHGGALAVETSPGRGATFVLSLPVLEESPASHLPAAARMVPTGLRILVVDDEAALRELMTDALVGIGNRVTAAADGREALDLLARAPVDVAILDVRMPGMGGLELWAEISRVDPELARRTVFCTGSVVGESTRASLEATGCPAVSKPFDLEVLFDAVARAASERGGQVACR